MEYALVSNGQVEKVGLPTTSTLSDGRTVSGFNLFDPSILILEGWFPIEENKPIFNELTEHLSFLNYEVQSNKVISHYMVSVNPPFKISTEEQQFQR